MAFTPGQSVMYNSICSTIIKLPGKRLFNPDATGYFIRENKSGTTYDNIPESELMNCSGLSICNEIWPDFIYTGDNNASSQWIMGNLIKFLHNTGNLEWGHNEDSTQYFFKINGTTLTKDKTSG